MNARIKQLEKQCWDYQTNHLNAEKFAKLIIEECCSLVHDPGEHSDGRVLKWKLRRHFGFAE
jgi:hypothetical protein